MRHTSLASGDLTFVKSQKPSAIAVSDVSKEFKISRAKTIRALEDINLQIKDGEFVALLGPSGCGKSTLLRLIAALDAPTTGKVTIHGRDPAEIARVHRLGVAFQDHALLPWLTAYSNIELPFQIAGRKPDRSRILELIKLVGLVGFENARPKHLSGGMNQRVAIARALALDPEVLLLDEPFGSLDAVTRRRMNLELQDIWARQSITTLLVTHSVEEAVFLADRVVLMSPRPGRVMAEQVVRFERPRRRDLTMSPDFHAMTNKLTQALDIEQQNGPQDELVQ